jgi:hypothetical protein
VFLVLSVVIVVGFVWRAKQFIQRFQQQYEAGRIEKMTPVERQAYDTKPPAILTVWPVLVVISLILLCVMMPYASPVVFVIWLAKLFNSKKTQRMLTRECAPVRPQETGADQDQSR